MAAAASAAKPRAADAARVTPEACVRHDALEGHEGETFVRLVWGGARIGRADGGDVQQSEPGGHEPRARKRAGRGL